MPPDQAANPLTSLFPFLVIFLIFYFLVIKPQSDKQKQHKEMVTNLKKNDEVVTMGGIHGTIINVKESTVIIRIDDDAKMEVDKEAVAVILKKSNL